MRCHPNCTCPQCGPLCETCGDVGTIYRQLHGLPIGGVPCPEGIKCDAAVARWAIPLHDNDLRWRAGREPLPKD